MGKYIIGTHDSVTGEKGKGFLPWLVTPFAKTQRLTIKEQFKKGCSFFDIRIKKVGNKWHGAHGLWVTKKPITEILSELDTLASQHPFNVYYCITYEGKDDRNKDEFLAFVKKNIGIYTNLKCSGVAIKLPTWQNIHVDGIQPCPYPLIHLFKTLDYRSWHTYFPCPWFWNLFFRGEIQEGKTNLFDFL